MRVASMLDLVRMLVSWSQRDRPVTVLYFEHNGRHIYGTLTSNHGYYEMYGLPLWVFTEGNSAPTGNFIAYRSRPKESVEFIETVDSEPLVFHLPIVRLAEKLEVLEI